ncbi:MAG: AAA family ATPase [Clostridia bacterium]|nr:AAA family ATPase [Clostridia bacterium]
MQNYIKNVVFKENQERYNELVELSEKIKKIKIQNKPYLIEFLGSCRSGKSTSIKLIADVLRKNGLNVLIVDEEQVKLTKTINENREKKMNIDSLNYTNNVIQEKLIMYDNFYEQNVDIIIFDRGINDEFIWLNTFEADEKELEEYNQKLSNRRVDLLIILTCDVDVSLKRKYFNSLSVMSNKWTNPDIMSKYLESLDIVSKYFDIHAKKIERFDSSNIDKIESALNICNKIIDNIS